MIRRLLLVSCVTVCCLPAQLRLYLLQNGSEAPITDQYGFGTLSLGDFRDIPFRLRNVGTGSAPLTILSLSGVSDFSFVNPPAVPQTVPAGAALDLTIRFQPAASGSSSTNFTADGVSAIFYGSALPAATISLDDGSGQWHVLMADAAIDFGRVMRGSSATRRLKLANTGGAALTIRNAEVADLANVPGADGSFPCTGAVLPPSSVPFQCIGVALPLRLAPGASAIMQLNFSPAVNGPQPNWALEIEQRRFTLTGEGIDPPFPRPGIVLDIASRRSAQQGTLTVRLAVASQATGTGSVAVECHPHTSAANPDTGILFLSTGGATASFSVKQGDTVAHFGSEDSVVFQTGTTAGDIVFTVKLGDFTETQTLNIAPAVMGVDPPLAQRTSAGLDLKINGFDNTRSASKLTFQFFDASGNSLAPGVMTVDGATAFQQFFGSSDLGGMFALHAFFPVIGNPKQVGGVAVEMVNSAGTSRTGRIPFVTP